jgi:diguanylate cyclase (GGDEF)-like protein
MKLKYLLISAFVILSAIPLFAGLHYLNERSGERYRFQFEEHLSALSSIAKKRVISMVDRVRDNTALIASRTQMRISLAAWNETGEQQHRERISRIINDTKNSLTDLQDIQLYDTAGKLVVSIKSELSNPEIDVASFDKPVIGMSKVNDLTLIVSTTPLSLESRRVGYLRILFYNDIMTDLVLDRAGLGDTGEWLFAVRDENGDALFAVPLKYDHKAAFERRVSRDRVDVPITQALLGNERIMSAAPDYRETPVLASTRYIETLDWGLVAKVDESEVNDLVNRNRQIIYITEIAIVIAAIIAGVFLSIFISGPIERLRSYSSRVAAGSLETPPQVGGWHEVKELTSDFARMVATLRDLNEDLNVKVEERTKELFDAYKKLEILAIQDSLTGLHNRRYFDERYVQEFERARRYGHRLAVVMLDIDHFKAVNDTYGHDFGDKVLKGISGILKNAARASDIVARIGGEEFCLILPEASESSSTAFLERLRIEIEETMFETESKPAPVSVTCSFGITYLNDDIGNAEELLKMADSALYTAKETGRNKVVTYTGSQSPKQAS